MLCIYKGPCSMADAGTRHEHLKCSATADPEQVPWKLLVSLSEPPAGSGTDGVQRFTSLAQAPVCAEPQATHPMPTEALTVAALWASRASAKSLLTAAARSRACFSFWRHSRSSASWYLHGRCTIVSNQCRHRMWQQRLCMSGAARSKAQHNMMIAALHQIWPQHKHFCLEPQAQAAESSCLTCVLAAHRSLPGGQLHAPAWPSAVPSPAPSPWLRAPSPPAGPGAVVKHRRSARQVRIIQVQDDPWSVQTACIPWSGVQVPGCSLLLQQLTHAPA